MGDMDSGGTSRAAGRGEHDLDRLLTGLDPLLRPGHYVYARASAIPAGVTPVVTVAEDEGLTLVCAREEADAAGLHYDFTAAWITLRVHSALDAVGLTAAVARHLAESGLTCNVVAGYHHDHLFVPFEEGQRAVRLLNELSGPAS